MISQQTLFTVSQGLYVLSTPKIRDDGQNTPDLPDLNAELKERWTGCVIDAAMIATVSPAVMLLCGNKTNFTTECLLKTGQAALSVLSEETNPFVIANFGFQSGRTVDKWKNLSPLLKWDMPFVENACAYFNLKVKEHKELSTHILFFCDVIDAESGSGLPLTYGEYQKNRRLAVIDAFKKYQLSNQGEK